MEEQIWDVVVVGGGPAGLAAALMLGRARRRTLVVDAGRPRNRFADRMHGVLGHDGIAPSALAARGRDEAAAYGVEHADGEVVRLDDDGDRVAVTTADGARRLARAAIVATGVADVLPDVPGLAERWGRGVLHCPYCHGWEVRDLRLGVLTASPLGLHQAQLVRQWSDRVVVFTAGLGPLEESTRRRLRARGVELVDGDVAEVRGDGDRVSGVRMADGRVIEVDALFTAGAPRPNDGFLSHLGLPRSTSPVGDALAVDANGRVGGSRIWTAGNVVAPSGNVPISIASGTMAGASVNAALVEEDVDAAVAASYPGAQS